MKNILPFPAFSLRHSILTYLTYNWQSVGLRMITVVAGQHETVIRSMVYTSKGHTPIQVLPLLNAYTNSCVVCSCIFYAFCLEIAIRHALSSEGYHLAKCDSMALGQVPFTKLKNLAQFANSLVQVQPFTWLSAGTGHSSI